PIARKVLVTMGGSDPENLTSQVLQALNHLKGPELQVAIVIGGGNQHKAEIIRLANISKNDLRLEVDARNMPDLMADADVAVSSASSTFWEICMLGLPAIVVDAAPNQVPLARALSSAQAAIYIPRSDFTPQHLAEELRLLIEMPELR